MNTKFTKGHWSSSAEMNSAYDAVIETIINAQKLTVAKVYGHSQVYDDAALIAAAPKMYALLDKLLNAGSWYSSALEIDTYEGYDGEELKKMIETVLAEARGEANEADKIG